LFFIQTYLFYVHLYYCELYYSPTNILMKRICFPHIYLFGLWCTTFSTIAKTLAYLLCC